MVAVRTAWCPSDRHSAITANPEITAEIPNVYAVQNVEVTGESVVGRSAEDPAVVRLLFQALFTPGAKVDSMRHALDAVMAIEPRRDIGSIEMHMYGDSQGDAEAFEFVTASGGRSVLVGSSREPPVRRVPFTIQAVDLLCQWLEPLGALLPEPRPIDWEARRAGDWTPRRRSASTPGRSGERTAAGHAAADHARGRWRPNAADH